MQKLERFQTKIGATLGSILATLAPGIAIAADPPTPTPLTVKTPSDDIGIQSLAVTIIRFLLIIAGALAVIFLIVGGIRYIFSSGNSDQIEKAKHTIIYAIIVFITGQGYIYIKQ